jgi:prepilin-type processing-associated H-X9-DG protein
MRRALGCTALVLGSVFVLLACLGFLLPFDFLFQLTCGWVLYLWRTAPNWSISGEGFLTGGVCLAVFTFGLHRFMTWFYARRQPAEQCEPAVWRWRWTLSSVAIIVLMFIAGIAIVGVTHQSAWLVRSPEPLVEGGRGFAARIQSQNNLKQLVIASHNYLEQEGVGLPAGAVADKQGRLLHGWQTTLLPYIEEQKVYDRIHRDLPWNHPDNAAAFRTRVRTYEQPLVKEEHDERGYALSHYAANARVLGGTTPRRIETITDGTSNTILAGEAAGNYKPWGHPVGWRDPALGINRTPDGFGSPVKGMANFAFCDGSVRTIRDDISPAVLKALSTPDGGEVIPDDY